MGLEEYLGDMEMCCRCSACKYIPLQMIKSGKYSDICPSIARYNFHAYSGGGRLLIGREMLKRGFEFTEKLLHIVYNCQMCGGCDISCKYAMDMEVLWPIAEFRIRCVEEGHTHPELDKVIELLRTKGKMVFEEKIRGEWAEGLEIKDAMKERVEFYYHVGCLSSLDEELQRIPRIVGRILKETGVDFGIGYENETCCGGRAFEMGYLNDFLRQAKANVEMFRKAGIKKIITACSECYYAFKVLYDRYNLKGDLQIFHISELLSTLIREGRLKPEKTLNIAVSYHDPCHLGRLGEPYVHWQGKKIPGPKFVFDPPRVYRRGNNGVYEPPREILKAINGVKIYEMERTREYAFCCGAGGGVFESNPEFSLWTARNRLFEAMESGAVALVTSCPWCEKNLRKATFEEGLNFKIYDIVEMLGMAL